MSSELTAESPFLRRLAAYLHQRFPLLGNVVLIISYYSSNQFLAQALEQPGTPMHYSPAGLMGALTLLCLFFHLRVFDEHKDFEEDCTHYPDRILQRGLITLKHLKILGALAIGMELLLSGFRGPGAFAAVLLALGFSLLMLKEFFVGAWLKKHFLLYALSHMLIMPLFAWVVYSFTTGRYPWEAPGWFHLYAWVGFFVTFNWEISRKIRAPEQELDGVDSYTKVFGTYGAANMVLLVRVIDTALVALVGWHLQLPWWFYAFLIALFGLCMTGYLQFRYNTNAKTAKRMEVYAGMYIIAFDLALAVTLVARHGLSVQAAS